MSETAIRANERTPEQDAAYFEARSIANRMSQQQWVSQEDFDSIYRATLHRHMCEALEPYLKAKARWVAMLPSPGSIVHPDGRLEPMPMPDCGPLDNLIESIKLRYTKGLTA